MTDRDMPDEPGLYELPQRCRTLHAEARELAASVADRAAVADEAARVDPVMRERLAASGLAAVAVGAEYGGRFERVDSLAVPVVREALAGASAHLDWLFALQGIGSYPGAAGGRAPARKRWLPAVATWEAIAALALTEPDVGSDLRAVTTTVRTENDELVIDGHKSFITNAGDASFYSVLCREGTGYSLVLVPADAPGLRVEHPHQIIAPHVLGDVILDGVRVPADHRLGEPGTGFRLTLATLATFRVSVAGAAVGLAQAALDEALRHTCAREQFGVPVARLGPAARSLALSWTGMEMAGSLAHQAAAAAAPDPLASLNLSSMAKVGATEVAGRVTDRAV